MMDRHPDAFLILGGDFNVCMSNNDSLNRMGTVNEKILTDFTKSNSITCEVMVSYRSMEKQGEYTWTR